MKALFLDVDGVLNCMDDIIDQGSLAINDKMLNNLKKIVEKTDAEIVLSSTWRLFPESRKFLKQKLESQGLSIMDMTKELPGKKFSQRVARCEEIKEWLDRNEVYRFAIIDDDDDAEIEGNFFLTNCVEGLTDNIAEMVIEHLNR